MPGEDYSQGTFRAQVISNIIETYHNRNPIPTSEWEREVKHNGEII